MPFGPANIASADLPVATAGGLPPADWLDAPAWAQRLVASSDCRSNIDGNVSVQIRAASDIALISVRVPAAAILPPADFEQATARAYTIIADRLSSAAASHPVRFWNFIPGIHAPGGNTSAAQADAAQADAAIDRYMIFNAGRFDACRQWFGGEDAFARLLATASGVGHDGDDLIIHALATKAPGSAVENPRQVPAYRYSRRYGPKPPCFSRATAVDLNGRRTILIGGTASVRGEESIYVGELPKQVGETLDNLAALLQAATGDDSAGPHMMTDVRVYHVRQEDLTPLRAIAGPAFPAARIEFVRADICRQDLLVEIEGVA